MYSPYREEANISLKIPWQPNTAKGFVVAVATALVLAFSLNFCEVDNSQYQRIYRDSTLSVVIDINFGDGDGTGRSKGNLSPEGAAHRSKESPSNLGDAKTAAQNTKFNPSAASDDDLEFNPIPYVTVPSTQKSSAKTTTGSDNKDLGQLGSGFTGGTGLGTKGTGTGAGNGFGDIEWGGGGNRKLEQKIIPKIPQGIRFTDTIKIQITVSADGSVKRVLPLVRGDARLESACVDALKRWRFNPIPGSRDMIGIIPFKLNLR